jgi:hypothetical protein
VPSLPKFGLTDTDPGCPVRKRISSTAKTGNPPHANSGRSLNIRQTGNLRLNSHSGFDRRSQKPEGISQKEEGKRQKAEGGRKEKF